MSLYPVEWFCISRSVLVVAMTATSVLCPAVASAQQVAIDKAHSTVSVRVYKSGLFSALAHNHIIQAPIASGSINLRDKSVELSFNVADMKVLDPDASESERQEIEATMKSQKVLDPAQFPTIRFASFGVVASGADRFQVTGALKLHGASHQVSVLVVLRDGKYTGSVTLKQTDYGITPVKIAGGAVKVKDEIVIEFSVVGNAAAAVPGH
jgi:polyisoprenoid-binding protein YceI